MVISKVKIVVIAHKFPPFEGVGANRWAHLSTHLVSMGYDVTILTVSRGLVPKQFEKIDVRKISTWGFYRIAGHSFANRYVNAIYKKCIDFLRLCFWFDDEAQYWGRALLTEIRRIVAKEKKIVLIATGHPFQVNRWAGVAKKEHGDAIFLIQDFRDPWFDNPFKKYFFSAQKNKVKQWQHEAVTRSDKNVYVTNGLKDLMEGTSGKGIVVENGHPFSIKNQNINALRNYIVHAGTLANGRDAIAEPFFKLCVSKPAVLKGKRVYFYGRVSIWLIQKYSILFNNGDFVLCDPIPQNELDAVYSNAKYALQFNAEQYPYLVSTKIYEHASKGLPTLSINCGGEVDTVVRRHQIGESAMPDPESIEKAISMIEQKDYTEFLAHFSRISTFEKRAEDYRLIINNSFQEASSDN